MCIYSVLSAKGGAGKTTTIVQLAIWLHQNDFTVAIVDNDKQRSIGDWLENHPADLTIVETENYKEMEKALYKMQESHDIVLVDNAGGDTLSMSIAMQASDHVLIPVQPSAVDINSTLDTIEDLKMARIRLGKSIPATVFLNRITKGSRIKEEVEGIIEDIQDVNLSSIKIPQTVRIQSLSGDGASIFDHKKN